MTLVLDASVFIASFAGLEVHHAFAHRLVNILVPPDVSVVVPTPFLAEVAAGVARKVASKTIDAAEAKAAMRYAQSPRFRLIPVDDVLAKQAAAIAWATGIRGYDSVYAAVAGWLRRGLRAAAYGGELRRASSLFLTWRLRTLPYTPRFFV